MASTAERREISRLVHRFGFGPKPGEFATLIAGGVQNARNTLLTPPAIDPGLAGVISPDLPDLGPFPPSNTPARVTFAQNMRKQNSDLIFWWLDRMVLANHGLTEKMVWFWHGHWATSIGKVEYSLPMKTQNETLRKYSLGNFADMAQAMLQDGALQFWLDGNQNQKDSPNENLARELMELFTLGVNHYSEDDVKALAKALTGFSVVRSTGALTFNAKKHEASLITFLGKVASFDPPAAVAYLTNRDDNIKFITDRIWFRFISTSTPVPDNSLASAFASRDILAAVRAVAIHPAMSDSINSQVKSPVEWFVSTCRALGITPSKIQNRSQVTNYLDKMAQTPFAPPNVGGWPYDEAWLNAASAQFRLAFADYLIKAGDLTPLRVSTNAPIQSVADWLGIGEFSTRTKAVLRTVSNDPARLALIALCSPEYVVNG